ncbi:MAG: hypothetical protein RLZZ628_1895 [Bacteroidota bacterium]|jgi:uncharacterized protein (TIGR00645 family)
MSKKINPVEYLVERTIFASRWLQVPLYLGLVVVTLLYSFKFLMELAHICHDITHMDESALMLGILTLIDMVMVANLLMMVLMGGYSTFVSHISLENETDRPDWLDKMDAGSMKAKLASSLVSISAIHLLRSFMSIEHTTVTEMAIKEHHLKWQVVIHLVFLLSAIMLAVTDYIMHKSHAFSHNHSSNGLDAPDVVHGEIQKEQLS